MNLKSVYLATLERCAPELLVQRVADRTMPRDVVAIGKCAGALLDGVANIIDVRDAFVAIPEGYKLPSGRRASRPPATGILAVADAAGRDARRERARRPPSIELHIGGHPLMTRASFEAGRALLRFVEEHDDILFLISGGGSACVEVPLPGHSEEELIERNAQLVASGLPISAINAERKELSAIKGGRLGARVRGRAVTLVYSDVASGKLEDVASGPSDRNMILVADNDTLTRTAADLMGVEPWPEQIECDVAEAAHLLARGTMHVAGGEPTVAVKGKGRGGRCSELAVRFAMESTCEALFASSDGVDGNSGAAGIYLPRRTKVQDRQSCLSALNDSDSLRIAAQIGEPIMITPTGNNLRDLFLVARD